MQLAVSPFTFNGAELPFRPAVMLSLSTTPNPASQCDLFYPSGGRLRIIE